MNNEESNTIENDVNEEANTNASFGASLRRAMLKFIAESLPEAIIIIGAILVAGYFIKLPAEIFIDTKSLKENIVVAVNNDAPLEVIETIFTTSDADRVTLFEWLILDAGNIRIKLTSELSLKEVLQTIRANYYTDKNSKRYGTQFSDKIDHVILELEETDPFGVLDENQKYLFETIRNKMGQEYKNIEADLNKVSIELDSKNKLVEEYLSKSIWGFWLSIVATILALLPIIKSMFNKIYAKLVRNEKDT